MDGPAVTARTVSFVAQAGGNGECFFWLTDADGYRQAYGDSRFALEDGYRDQEEVPPHLPWEVFPAAFSQHLPEGQRFRLTVTVEPV